MADKATFAGLSLFPATPEQVLQSRRHMGTFWGRGLTMDEFLLRDEIMDKEEHSADGKLVVWVLAPREDPTTLDFMCSCKTYRRAALSSSYGSTELAEVVAYGVASVFTPLQHRKKGYARHMMSLLHWVLAPRDSLPSTFPLEWGAPPDTELVRSLGLLNAKFSVLYSDIGKDFYHSCSTDASPKNDGWAVHGAVEISKKVPSCDETVADAFPHTLPKGTRFKRLTEEEVEALYEHDARWIKDDLTSTAAADPLRAQFSFLPDLGVGKFVIRRTMSFDGSLQPVLPMAQWGVALLPSSPSISFSDIVANPTLPPVHFVSWTIEARTSARSLVVARVRADETSFPALLAQLLAVAHEAKCVKVEFWYLQPELLAIAKDNGWTVKERPEHLSAVKWYGEEGEDKLDWLYNEKFCWC